MDAQPVQNLTLSAIVRAIRRNLLLVVGFTGLMVAGVVAWTLLSGTLYECKGSLWIQRSRSLIVTSPLEAPEASQQLLIAFMGSQSLRLLVAKELKLADNPDFWGPKAESKTEEDLLARLEKMIEVYEVRTKPVIELTVKAPTADLSFRLASALFEQSVKRADLMQTSEANYLDERLKMRTKSLEEAVLRLSEFQTKNGIVTDITKQGQVSFESAAVLKQELVKTQSEQAGVTKMLDAPGDVPAQLQMIARKDGLDGSVDYLRQESYRADEYLARLPELGAQYTLLNSKVQVEVELLKQTTATAEAAKLKAEQENPKIVTIDAPRQPIEPVNELPARIILSVLFGGLAGLVLAAIRETVANLPKGQD